MIPDALDIERLRAALDPESVGYRPDWAGLTPYQAWAMMAAETRGQLHHERDWQAAIDRVGRLNSETGTTYPADDPEAMHEIVQTAHDQFKDWHVVTNYFLTRRLQGGETEPSRTLGDELTSQGMNFRNFWQTGTSQGAPSRPGRGWTEELFAYGPALRRTGGDRFKPSDQHAFDPLKPSEMPKYGALVSEEQHAGSSSRYGNVAFYWKDSVRDRSTYTPTDSLREWSERGVLSYTDKDHLFPLLAYGHDDNVRLALAKATDFRFDAELRQRIDSGEFDPWGYFESQIHGDLTWQDVDHIVVNWGDFFKLDPDRQGPPMTREDAEQLVSDLREFAASMAMDTAGHPSFTVLLGREIGTPGAGEAAAAERVRKIYGLAEGARVSARDLAVARALDRLAHDGPFAGPASKADLHRLARRIGISPSDGVVGAVMRLVRPPDPQSDVQRLWAVAKQARALHGDEVPLTAELIAVAAGAAERRSPAPGGGGPGS